mmetsp:Transcript_91615/g.290666  ORF Transcript_91615/g.290666 Transcript_91615/m.290666 type:complete len:445 (-) Transcript_91615:131-1465(-)
MGGFIGSGEVADNQEVEHESGLSRLCSSILCTICVAPLLLIGVVFLLGYNERRAVCDAKVITQGKAEVTEVGCTSKLQGSGELVMFSCDLSRAGLAPLTAANTDFESVLGFVGTGLSVQAEMYQCVETVQSATKKDRVGGGQTTVKTYTYSKEWRSHHVDSGAFSRKTSQSFIQNCGVENPQWPAGAPTSGEQHAPSARVGPFTIKGDFVRKVPLSASVRASSTPSGWTLSGGTYESSRWALTAPGPSQNIGMVRVTFMGTDWAKPKTTVLGQNNGGTLGRWTASDSWLCSGFTLGDLRQGVKSKDELFQALESEANILTYLLRFLGFGLAWFAFSRCVGPLEVAADCVPCIGPCLGDSIEAVGCCISCLPACACSLLVIGVVWVAMRPQVGVPMVLFFVATVCGFAAFKMYTAQQKQEQRASRGSAYDVGPDPENVGKPADAE